MDNDHHIECSEVELLEDPNSDWRSTFQRNISELRTQFATYHKDYLYRRYGTKDVFECAKREATKSVERAIIQYYHNKRKSNLV